MVDGRLRHLSAAGLYDGLVLLADDETRTYWNHLTGEALYGPDPSQRMATFPLRVIRVGAALKQWPDLEVAVSRPGLFGALFSWITGDVYASGWFMPPGFSGTMAAPDPRLPEETPGLGVMAGEVRRFYPVGRLGPRIEDAIDGRARVVEYDPAVGPPVARWAAGGLPLQVPSRWYGFSYTYPGCEVWAPAAPQAAPPPAESAPAKPRPKPVPGKVTIVDYHAAWCAPCRLLTPRLERLARAREDVVLVRVDVSDWDDARLRERVPGATGLPVVEVWDAEGRLLQRLQGSAATGFADYVPAAPGRGAARSP